MEVAEQKEVMVPKLRFREFAGEWRKCSIDSLGSIVTGSTPPTAIREYYDGEFLFASPADIQENRYVLTTKTTLTELGFKKGRLIRKGSVLFVCIGSTIGKVGQAGSNCITNQQINSVVTNDNFEDDFVYLILKRQASRIKLLAGEQAVPMINKTDFSLMKVFVTSLPEQQKIASFLSAVDERLGHLARKKQLLQQYKKGVMQQLFSQQLRFKREDGSDYEDWEEKRLGEVATITTGSSNRIDSSLDGRYTFFDRSEDIRTSSIYLFDGEAVIVAGEGQAFVPKYFVGKFDLHQRTYAVMNFNQCVGKFIFYSIGYYRNYFLSKAVGSTVKSLRLPMFVEMPVNLPCLAEQQKIADFLSSLDEKINAVGAQIQLTQQFKKGLLQELFV